MSADKLVDSTQLDRDLTSVANAIRAKSGGSSQLAFPAGFVSEIGNIPSGGGDLPDAYQQVEYIEGTNTGSGPYLKIPYIPVNGHVIKGRTYIASKPSSSMLPIDCLNGSNGSRLEIGYSATEGNFYFWSNKTIVVIGFSDLYGAPIEFAAKYSTSQPYRTLTVKTATDEKTAQSTDAYANYTDIQYMFVFAKSYLPFTGRVYGVYVETESGSKALDLVPCYRKSDNAIGMYDVVRGAFYTNDGSGSFTKGQDVLSAQQALNVLLGGAT